MRIVGLEISRYLMYNDYVAPASLKGVRDAAYSNRCPQVILAVNKMIFSRLGTVENMDPG